MVKLKLYTSKSWLHRKYVLEKKTEQEIANEAGTSQATIHRWLVTFGLKGSGPGRGFQKTRNGPY